MADLRDVRREIGALAEELEEVRRRLEEVRGRVLGAAGEGGGRHGGGREVLAVVAGIAGGMCCLEVVIREMRALTGPGPPLAIGVNLDPEGGWVVDVFGLSESQGDET